MTRWEAGAGSAVRSSGNCGLYIVHRRYHQQATRSSLMYIRTEETLIIPTNQNQPGRPEKEITLSIRWQKRQ